jgi:hypothetical protein
MALLNLVYRDQLFPRDAYRLTFDQLLEKLPEKSACSLMVKPKLRYMQGGCGIPIATDFSAECVKSQAIRD